MRSVRSVVCVLLVAFAAAAWAQSSAAAMSEPSVSPDGREIAFVSGGDIWTVPASGGEARLLVSDPATESRPMYSPDGKYLAFISTRTGNGDIYVLTLATGELRRMTYDDSLDQLDGWSRDSHWLYFSSSAHDISGMNDIYRVALTGGTPMAVTAERYVNEFFAAPSPDGKSVAFTARGIGSSQWWRKGHAHIDQSEIWSVNADDTAHPQYVKLVSEAESKNLWPMWSADGTLYFMSDRSGSENLYRRTASGDVQPLTAFKGGRVLWPAISADGKTIVFERDFGIWRYDVASAAAAPVRIALLGVPAGAGVEHRTITSGIREMALSPDGKKLVFIVHGEIFAVGAKDGGDGIRITNTVEPESQVSWAPDNKRIMYISTRNGRDHVYLYDFTAESETQLTRGDSDEAAPKFSPDGKKIAFQRGLDQLVVLDLKSKKESVVAHGRMDFPPFGSVHAFTWSPDGRWIAYLSAADRQIRNAYVVRVDGGEARQVSFLGNVFAREVSWSADGTYLLIDSGQRTENGVVARIDLVPHTPHFREDQFRDLFKEDKPGTTPNTAPEKDKKDSGAAEDKKPQDEKQSDERDAKTPSELVKQDSKDLDKDKRKEIKPVEVVFDGIRERLTVLPVGIDVSAHTISPDGKWLALVADAAGQQNVYLYSLDELAKEPAVAKQLTSTAGRKSSVYFSPDSKDIFYLDEGKLFSTPIDAPKAKPVTVSAEMDVDFDREKSFVFDEGWRMLSENFFDAHMNGVNWLALHDVYAAKVREAKTGDEMRRIMLLMIGELNASHSGIRGPDTSKPATGRLGLRFDRASYESSGAFRVSEVTQLGPADVAGIKAGEQLVSVNGTTLDSNSNLDALLDHTIERRVSLGVKDANGKTRTVALKPIKGSDEKALLYRQWVDSNRQYVAKISGGKLGYVHMFDMSEDALNRLFLDLDTENLGRKGVVIDIRNNNGGFVNAYAIDVLARRGYMTMTRRGYPAAPARTVLGQRSLELPTILVTNRHSLSDAEDFTEGYRALKLGSVVGERTAGWIIYTSNMPLLDGSVIRVPFTRITDHEGHDMEMHPRAVDLEVEDPIGETLTGEDSQLQVAVRELLKQIDGNNAPKTKSAGN